jgi:hypothetical protein
MNFSAHDMQMLNTTAAAIRSGMGAEMLEPMECQNRPLVAYTFPQNRRRNGQAAGIDSSSP